RSVSTRACRQPGLEWVSRFTPHRVLRESATDRIVLDANTLRNIAQGAGKPEDALDLVALASLKGDHPVSIANTAWAETVEALARAEGGLTYDEWARAAEALDP